MKKLILTLTIVLLSFGMLFAGGEKEAAAPQAEAPLKIGMIYVSPPGDMGYSFMHAQGTKAAKEYFGDKVEFIELESVPENEQAAVEMENLIDEGCEMIFATSYNYQDYMLEVAKQHPDVHFEHCSGYLSNDNMSNYFGRMYQMRYLSGMIAGAMAENGKIGYIGAYNTPEVIRGANAFTLGAQRMNPDVEVRVVWTNTWFDPQLERQAAMSLLDEGVDVIAQHQDTTEPAKAAISRGKYAIGYNADFRAIIGDDRVLVSPMWNWQNYVIPSIQSHIDGTWESQSYWGGLEDEMIKLSEISPLVPAEVVAEVEKVLNEMHDKTFDVFWGELYDNEGNKRQDAGEKMSDADMLSMNWFVKGITGSTK